MRPLDQSLAADSPVAVVLTDDIDAVWAEIQQWGDGLDSSTRLVACQWQTVPRVDQIISDVVRAFAATALSDWPSWYGIELTPGTAVNYFEQDQGLRQALQRVSREHLHVLAGWLRRAAGQCMQGQIPFDSNTSAELQAGQLALAISSRQLMIAFCTADENTAHAAGLIAAAEWFCRVARARVRLIVPLAWRNAMAASRVNAIVEQIMHGDHSASDDPAPASSEMVVHVSALAGRPHPASEAEQLLCRQIAADPQLAGLLEFNRTIEVDLARPFRVDLLCRRLKLVVEVDGRDHRTASKYIDDCHRDYQLMKHGYLVLRLPDEVVLSDPQVAMARIRDMVKVRSG